jgi:hypothetical protein
MSMNYTPDPKAAEAFARKVRSTLASVHAAASKDAIVDTGKTISWDFVDPRATEYGAARGAELIGMKLSDPTNIDSPLVENPNAEWSISGTTREEINGLIDKALAEGWSYQEFADELQERFPFSDARAETIARSEVGIAQNRGQVTTFGALGFKRVEVIDGGGDNPCDECEAVDGEEWSIEEADGNPLEHPSCGRRFLPIDDSFEGEEAA